MSLGFKIKPVPHRPDYSVIERLGRHDSADLSDVLRHSTTMSGLVPISGPATRIAGVAVTVSLPLGGVDMLKAALDQCRAGDVLVVAARGALGYAMFGGTIAKAMVNRGLAGLVVDGAVRDADDIAKAGLPTFARGEVAIAAIGDAPGEINVPVACAGVVVNPGDIVIGDLNGVVAIDPTDVEEIEVGVTALRAKFESWASAVDAGEVPGLGGLYRRLQDRGCDVSAIDVPKDV